MSVAFRRWCGLACAAVAAPSRAASQPPPRSGQVVRDTPALLAARVLAAFADSAPAAFDRVDPDSAGRGLVRDAAARGWARRADVGRVVWQAPGRAVLLLGGTVLVPANAGEQTNASWAFSGLYEASPDRAGAWTLGRKLPLDSANRITAHALHVDLTPGRGLRVVDTLGIAVGSPYGFAVRLNHRARLADVRLDGGPAAYAQGGGLVWVASPPRGRARLVLAYALDVDHDTTDTRAGSFQPTYGHVGVEYVWHPFFDYASGHDVASVRVTVRVPAAVHVSTTLPQVERVRGGERRVVGRSAQPTALLGLLYDRDWRPAVTRAGPMRFETFTTSDFRPSADSLAAAFRRTYDLLSARFGAPPAGYVAVAQARALRVEGNAAGFYNRLNDVVLAAAQGGDLVSGGPEPSAVFSHEVAHGWTHPTGPAEALLSEGWAMFAESAVIGDALGADAERAFWEARRSRYYRARLESRVAILNATGDRWVSYTKGPWVLRGLRSALGDTAFRDGMRAYAAIPPGRPAGVDEFTAALSRAAGRDVGPLLRPWLTATTLPDVRARVVPGADGPRLVLAQGGLQGGTAQNGTAPEGATPAGPVFELPNLEVEMITAAGPVRRVVHLRQREDTVDLRDVPGPVTAVRIDPEHRYLLRRSWGEVARFAVQAPDATGVALWGDFAPNTVRATRTGDTWTVEIPLSEGVYHWAWGAGGKPLPPAAAGGDSTSGVRTVRAAQPLDAAYPRPVPP